MIGETQKCFKIGKTPPTITADKSPESLGNSALKTFETSAAGGAQCLAIPLHGDIFRLRIVHDRSKGPGVAVMAGD